MMKELLTWHLHACNNKGNSKVYLQHHMFFFSINEFSTINFFHKLCLLFQWNEYVEINKFCWSMYLDDTAKGDTCFVTFQVVLGLLETLYFYKVLVILQLLFFVDYVFECVSNRLLSVLVRWFCCLLFLTFVCGRPVFGPCFVMHYLVSFLI